MKLAKALAGILMVAGFLFSPVSFGISSADISPTSSAVEIQFQHGLGSGVYIGHGLVVTARHVALEAGKGWMIVRDQAGEQVDAVTQWVSKTTDVAVVRIKSPLNMVGASELDKRAPAIGESLEVVGCPYGRPFVHTLGQVTGQPINLPPEWRDAVPISAEVHPGNSGGPAYDQDGKVLGIVVGALTDKQGRPLVNIMISAREVAL